MQLFNRFNTYLILLLAGLLQACTSDTPRSNKVTITPSSGTTQSEKALPPGMDASPMDMSYYPVNYPVLKMQNKATEPLTARVIYGRPQRNNRTIFGKLVPYGKVWRLGANEATEIEFFKDVYVQEKKISKGRYVLYCIPYEDSWTLILNNDLFTWGLKIDSSLDVHEFNIPIAKTGFPYEVFTMEFEKAATGIQLVMEWDSVKAVLPIRP